jgi:hypothetical protein
LIRPGANSRNLRCFRRLVSGGAPCLPLCRHRGAVVAVGFFYVPYLLLRGGIGRRADRAVSLHLRQSGRCFRHWFHGAFEFLESLAHGIEIEKV